MTDNGLVFTARLAHGGKTSRNGLETELARLHIKQKNSRPNHPTTCGKVERFQQTMKRWLNNQPCATTIIELQQQLDTFTSYYTHQRPHRSLPNAATPAAAYTLRPKATPNPDHGEPEPRVRYDRINNGPFTLRFNGNMHKIGPAVRVIHATTGEVLRQVTLNPNHRYYGTGKPRGGPQRPYGPRKSNRRNK